MPTGQTGRANSKAVFVDEGKQQKRLVFFQGAGRGDISLPRSELVGIWRKCLPKTPQTRSPQKRRTLAGPGGKVEKDRGAVRCGLYQRLPGGSRRQLGDLSMSLGERPSSLIEFLQSLKKEVEKATFLWWNYLWLSAH